MHTNRKYLNTILIIRIMIANKSQYSQSDSQQYNRPWDLKGKLLVSSIIKFSQLDSIGFEYLLVSMMCQPSGNVWKLCTES